MRTAPKRALVVAVAALAALSLASCSSSGNTPSSSSSSSTPYRVLVLGGLSNASLADQASTSVDSAKAGAAVINKSGGIDGHKVVLTVVDDQGDPTTAVSAVRSAINSSTPPNLILNSGPSTIASATLPIISQAGILSMNIGPTPTSSNPSDFPLNFDLSPGPTEYMKGFVTYFKSKGYKTVGILHGNDAYGTSLGTLADSSLSAAGFKIVSNTPYDVTALDMTAQIQTVEAAKPDVLLLDAYGAPVGYVLQGIQKLGWNVPIAADNSVPATPIVSEPAPAGILGTPEVKNLTFEVFKSTKYDPSATLVNQAVAAMKAVGPIKTTLILAYNYDAFALVNAAATKAGSIDSKAIAKELVVSSVTSSAKTAILGDYGFTASAHAPNISGSEFEFIGPSKIADGQFH